MGLLERYKHAPTSRPMAPSVGAAHRTPQDEKWALKNHRFCLSFLPLKKNATARPGVLREELCAIERVRQRGEGRGILPQLK